MDYEALGRYTAGVEVAKAIAEEFNRKSGGFAALVQRDFNGRFDMTVPKLDAAKLRADLQVITELHAKLFEAAREVNMYAQRCGKPEIDIRT
jgi:hypothetical protein